MKAQRTLYIFLNTFNTYIVGYHFVIRINEIRMMGITIDDRHAQNSEWTSTQSNFLSPNRLHRLDDSKNDAEVSEVGAKLKS